jgi:hypothetical protein
MHSSIAEIWDQAGGSGRPHNAIQNQQVPQSILSLGRAFQAGVLRSDCELGEFDHFSLNNQLMLACAVTRLLFKPHAEKGAT